MRIEDKKKEWQGYAKEERRRGKEREKRDGVVSS
jgi:hypothetical protein